MKPPPAHAVLSTLAAYDAEDEQELRLAAEIISFGFAALEALAKAMNPDLPLNAVLRLRGNANAAHRSGHQCQRTLDKLRKERRSGCSRSFTRARNTGPSGRLTRGANRKPAGANSAGSSARPVAAAAPGTGTQGGEGAAERGRTRSIGCQDREPDPIFADQRDASVPKSSHQQPILIQLNPRTAKGQVAGDLPLRANPAPPKTTATIDPPP